MKVLQIINSLETGGAEKLLIDSLSLYEERGVDIDLFLLQKNKTPFAAKLKKQFKGKIFYSKIRNLYSIKQVIEIKKYLPNYDIVHVHLFPAFYWTALAKIILKSSTSLIFTEHNTHNRRIDNPLFRILDKFIYKKYTRITAITPQVKDVLVNKLKIPPKKIDVIYNGIDIRKYKMAQAYCKTDFFDSNSIILIQVSRFQKQKDQKTVIRALGLLPEQYKLLLVGEGQLREECEKLAFDLNIKERVKFLGVRMDIPELFKTSDIVVQSSHWEGFGLTAVEGMAAGKPVITSNVPGLANIVKDAGLLFEKGDEKELASKLLKLENIEYRKTISDRCQRKADEFDIHKMVSEMIEVYHKLLGKV